MPGRVVGRVRAGGGWSRSSPRAAALGLGGAPMGVPGRLSGGCGPVGAGRAVPRAPGELQSSDGPIPTSRTTTDRSPHRAPRRAVGRVRRAGDGVGGVRPQRPASVTEHSSRNSNRRTEDGYPPPRPRPTHRTRTRYTRPHRSRNGPPQAPRGAGNCAQRPPPPNPQPPAQPPELTPTPSAAWRCPPATAAPPAPRGTPPPDPPRTSDPRRSGRRAPCRRPCPCS